MDFGRRPCGGAAASVQRAAALLADGSDFIMHPQHFGRLLLVILPGTMILTYLLKLTSSDMLRRDAIAELYHSTDEIAAQAPTVVHHYITGGPAASSCSEAERAALFRAGAKLGGANWLLRSGWGEAADDHDRDQAV